METTTTTPRRAPPQPDASSYVSMPPSPSHTPRSSSKAKRPLNHTSNAASSPSPSFPPKPNTTSGVNIQVLLRCRPLSQEELRVNTPVVITCNEQRREVSAAQNIANKQIDRTFVFDKVFGPKSRQQDVFNHAVVPLVGEVLDGYNCTIFAYGQTGTGKTYTMEGGGGSKTQDGVLPSDAGVIPRAVKRIFDILEAQNAEYSMKVSFLELYNEELTDLLAPEESKFSDDKSKKPMALMEDGKGGVFVRGLEEEVVSSAGEIYKILERGSAKRKTAETFLNKQSSRSHSIFSITIHIKECTPEGEELIKCGKLNLVDLAGSENISRSGARDGRAREAGEINKSLLTLGRVINTLVEHSGHIPYRDSKLTRLLRDSLGGKTKTCIIATIAPSVHCLDETLSTLDYAHRAKNIKNKPEVNQKMMKSALIKDLYFEMDRLKQELYAAREKNGIYVPGDQYLADEAEKKAMSEKLDRLELGLESKDKQLDELQELYDSQKVLSADLSDKLQTLQKKMQETECALADLEGKYMQANNTIKEKEYLIENLLKSEKVLVHEAQTLRSELENTTDDLSGLFSKLERKGKTEDANKNIVRSFHSQLTQDMNILHRTISTSVSQQESQLKVLEEEMQSFITSKDKVAGGLKEHARELKESFSSRIEELHGFANELNLKSQLSSEKLDAQVSTHTSDLEDCLKGLLADADQLLLGLQNDLSKQEEGLTTLVEQQHEELTRNVERTKSISATTMNFFGTIDAHALELKRIMEESQVSHQKQLLQLQTKFEVCAADEEKYLMEKVAGLLAESNARKKNMVRDDISNLNKTASERSNNLQSETTKLWAIKAIDKIRKGFLWKGRKNVKGGHCLLAWSKVTRPKELGGLGIQDLRLLGWALRVRWLWLQKTEPGRPWAEFPIQTCSVVQNIFYVAVVTQVGDGTNTLFWKDRWLYGKSIKELAPAVYASVPTRIANKRLVSEALMNFQWVNDFQGALTFTVLLEYFELYETLEGVVLQPEIPDTHIWKFSSSGQYSTKSAYEAMFCGSTFFGPAERIWKTWAPGKCRFFMWLVEHNRCWTAIRLAKRGLPHPERCPLCDQHEETIEHLLVSCVFTRQFWFELLRVVGLQDLAPQQNESFEGWWNLRSSQLDGQPRKGFDSMVILGAWIIWKHRNRCVFHGDPPSLAAALLAAREEALAWSLAGAKGLSFLQALHQPG